MFNQVTIIGFGHIGSSIAKALRYNELCKRIVAADASPSVCEKVVEIGLVDEVYNDLAKAVHGSELVILCIPVGAMGIVTEHIAPALEEGAILTDVGSVKMSVIDTVTPFLPDGVDFVPAHPLAGTENSGPESGIFNLFEKRWCLLTPTPETSIKAVEHVTKLWEGMGARIDIMSPKHHDLVLGLTSHLPHLIAYTIVDTANSLEDDLKGEVIKYSASGFRGFTRIAASDPTMWRDVFLNNREAMLEVLQHFAEDLTVMQKAIRKGDGDYLFDVFSRTRAIRREVIELGEAGVPAPGLEDDRG